MGANYRKHTGQAPRSDYSPRKLVPANSNSPKERFYGKGEPKSANDNAKDESLPKGWSILEPNRVKERRLAAGYATTDSLAMKIGTMSYQRLHKIESGVVVVRDSEYELIAQVLEMPVSMLKLPMLMHSETVRWMELWGKDQRLEEGGDHDAVLLAAYVRYHARKRNLNKAKICKMAKVSSNAMHFIWHAAKPIDRYPDSTMMATMMLTGNSSWDKVIRGSLSHYAAGLLTEEIKKVQKPRVRYAPEDPDKRAPWTYDINPLREHQPRRQFINAYAQQTPVEWEARIKGIKERRRKTHRLIEIYEDAKIMVGYARDDKNPLNTLMELCPYERETIAEISNQWDARVILLRFIVISYLQDNEDVTAASFASILGVTPERVYQMQDVAEEKGLAGLIAQNTETFLFPEVEWSTFRSRNLKRAA